VREPAGEVVVDVAGNPFVTVLVDGTIGIGVEESGEGCPLLAVLSEHLSNVGGVHQVRPSM
jgi:hypothetical protein